MANITGAARANPAQCVTVAALYNSAGDQDPAWRADLDKNQLTPDFTNGRDTRKYWDDLAAPLKSALDDLGLTK